MKNVIYYTDGACNVNTGNGGFAFVRTHINENGEQILDKEYSLGYSNTTNNRMELSAIIFAIVDAINTDKHENTNIIIKSDSQYCIKSINEWIKGWIKNDFFRNNPKRAIKNIEYWENFLEKREELNIMPNIKSVKFEWVKGHSIDKFNNIADSLAVKEKNILENKNK